MPVLGWFPILKVNMNKQIKHLMQQSGWINLNERNFSVGYFPGMGIEKFAELIIKECANVAAEHDALDIYEEIRDHFGVEE